MVVVAARFSCLEDDAKRYEGDGEGGRGGCWLCVVKVSDMGR